MPLPTRQDERWRFSSAGELTLEGFRIAPIPGDEAQQHYRDDYLRRFLGQARDEGPSVLQLGGSDPQQLYEATQTVLDLTERGHCDYTAINLNCGCPSNAVSGRSGGCALMRNPSQVAECVERMSEAIFKVDPTVELSVKHRLGVRNAATYDAEHDKQQDDEEAYQECEHFIETITRNSNVQKLQVLPYLLFQH